MARITLEMLNEIVKTYVDENKISQPNFNATSDNIVGLLDKVGKMFTLDSGFYDKLPELDGEELRLGKTVEEWYEDLIAPVDFTGDKEGNEAMKFYSPSYRPVCYSYSLGRKKIPISVPNGNIERACLSSEDASEVLSKIEKRLADSRDQLKYTIKRELIGKTCDMVESAITGATAYTSTTNVVEGTYYKSGNDVYVALTSRTHASGDTIDKLVASGVLVPFLMKVVIAKPSDTATGEAFIRSAKEIIEKAKDVSEGYSFNGNTIGAETGLAMFVKQGVIPSLEVDTMAGAFNKDELNISVKMKSIKDFGKTTSKAYAILCDNRALRLFPGYRAVRSNTNGSGDFLNLFAHEEYTAHVSRNAFIVIFCEE